MGELRVRMRMRAGFVSSLAQLFTRYPTTTTSFKIILFQFLVLVFFFFLTHPTYIHFLFLFFQKTKNQQLT